MKSGFFCLTVIGLALAVVAGGCAQPATPPPVDLAATDLAQLVAHSLTQTAVASSLTPAVTLTSTPTETPAVTATSTEPIKLPLVLKFAACWFGPGPGYELESHINKGQRVQLLGVGNVPGWYIIANPYFHRPCWIQATDLDVDPRIDVSRYPQMTPAPPLTGGG